MNPISFKEANVLYSDKGKDTVPMPALRINNQVVVRWRMNFFERVRVLFTGNIWIRYGTPDGNLPGTLVTTAKSDLITVGKKNE